MNRFKKWSLWWLVSIVLVGCSTGHVNQTMSTKGMVIVKNELDGALSQTLVNTLSDAFTEISADGAIVAVQFPQGTWLATVGAANADNAHIVPSAYQRIGSVTKTFVVTALLQLVDEGVLSLDDPIGKYISNIPNPHATLLQLAAMQSGIPSYTLSQLFQEDFFAHTDKAWHANELIDFVRTMESLFAPGERVNYSNTNTVLLGMVIEKVTHQPLQKVLKNRIFDVLGLKHTFFPVTQAFPLPHMTGYTLQGLQQGDSPVNATDWNPSWGWAAGNMISNVDDLLIYAKELVVGGKLLSPAMQEKRIQSFNFDVPPNSPARAYGWGLGLANGWYGHTGELPGYNTVLQHHLAQGVTLIVMTNSDIPSGSCPSDVVVLPNKVSSLAGCHHPAVYLANKVAAAIHLPVNTF